MMEFIIAITTSVITGGLTLTGVIFTSRKQHDVTVQEIKTELALMHQEIEQLEKKQDIHNGVIERVYQLEKAAEVLDERQKTANHRIDDLANGAQKMDIKKWFKAAGVRAVKTIAQTAVGVIGSSAIISEVDWRVVVSASILAGVVSLLTSVAGLPEIKEN